MAAKRTRTSRKKKNKVTSRGNGHAAREPRVPYRVTHAPRPPDPIVEKELPRAVERIVNALHPEKIILFGSFAYGKPTYDSDVDLLVIWDTKQSWKERHLEVARLLHPRVFAVDLLVRTPQEIKNGLEKGDFFLREITTQGRVLYERRD